MKKKEKNHWTIGLGHLCLLVTIVMIVWSILYSPIDIDRMKSDFLKGFFVLISGIGGVMIYIVIGVKLEEIRKKYGKRRKDKR